MIFDLSKPAQLEQLIAEIAKINDLEMVINCTEYGTSKKEFYKDNQTSEDISNIDTITHMKFSHQTLNIMKKRKHGIIIHVS
jgi:short-subunit dehydrogenase